MVRLILPTLALIAASCVGEVETRQFAARVGSDVLYEDELQKALAEVPPDQDSLTVRTSYIDRWIASAVLAHEARRLGISDDPEVRGLIRDNERSVLATSMMGQLYDESAIEPTQGQIAEYYSQFKEQLALREPYVRVRHLWNTDRDQVVLARRLLQRALRGSGVDSTWLSIATRFSEEPTVSISLQSTHRPASRLFQFYPEVAETLAALGNGQVAQIIESGSAYHLLQLVDRADVGSTPALEWVSDEIKQLLELQLRKEAYARSVQKLRTEAEARNEIQVR